jgi:hypothetical protein
VVEESLLTDEVRAHIGKATPRGLTRITPQALYRASDTYFGGPWPVDIAPGEPVPGMVIAALETETGGLELPSVLPNGLLISNEWQFERPLRMGEEFEVQSRLADISERFGGRFGYSLYFRTEVEFREPGTANVVARTAVTMMQYDASNAANDGEGE